jgi:D-tyrosyl-tRNA(Tyr) deacylase
MKAVVQRVSRASVRIDSLIVGEIGGGLLVLLGIGKEDVVMDADWIIKKLLALRIFPDDAKNMNRSVTDIGGGLLVVSQFTLYGDPRNGTRPSFTDAMPPAEAEKFYNEFMVKLRAATALKVAEGKFAAMMDVELINDGPVTIILDSAVGRASRPLKAVSSTIVSGRDARSTTANDGDARSTSFIPFDSSAVISKQGGGNLPHWQQDGRTYFVTFRLADSLPQEKLRLWMLERDQWLKQHPEPRTTSEREEFEERFTEALQKWLDAGYGECWLKDSKIAALVAKALRHFDHDRYLLGEFVIMPNHVHVLVTPVGKYELPDILHSLKSYTAHEINQAIGRTGKVWQDESFDHIVRDEQALLRFSQYIQANPAVAGLKEGEYCVG